VLERPPVLLVAGHWVLPWLPGPVYSPLAAKVP
jgi:hypothetical protein